MKKLLKTVVLILTGLFTACSAYAQFSHNLQGNNLPWTGIPETEGSKFRFVIISDLTGGEKEGVFATVVEKINELDPDFVMCVGDLIDGYTIDSQVMVNQWKSFHERLAKLKAPFFYMPGNHDISNGMLFKEWIRQYGYDYYSFYMSGTLFLIINAYEGKEGELSEKQVQYIKKVLLQHDPERPVIIFSHPPLWDHFSKKGLDELEPLFNRYKTTFFCGDDHHYIMKSVKGRTHYMLSNTGGGFDRENKELGIFNHILWVTSDSGRLTIANILTDGILPVNIVDDSTEKQVYSLMRSDWLKINPTYIMAPSSGKLGTIITARNKGDFPLLVSGRFLTNGNVTVIPDTINFTVPSGGFTEIPVSMINSGKYEIDDLPETDLVFTGTYYQGSRQISNSYKKQWIIDNLKMCMPVNGDPREIASKKPGAIEESWSWSGLSDGSFSFSASYDRDYIYIRIRTTDDIVITNPGEPEKPQDRLYIDFSADTSLANSNYLRIQLSDGKKHAILSGQKLKFPLKGSCSADGNSLVAEVLIPATMLSNDFFRLNIGFRDQDDKTSSDQSILWWKPKWGSGSDYRWAGMFRLKGEK